MNIQQVLRQAIQQLKNSGNEAPALEAGVLLCHCLRRDRAFLYAHGDQELEAGLEKRFVEMLCRRVQGEPLQYITATQEFMGLELQVGPGVLIPRQDTETLVEHVLEFLQEKPAQRVRVLDLCTGSGCIAVSVAHYHPSAEVTAVDISETALDIAQRNAAALQLDNRVAFLQGDLYEALGAGIETGVFDVIVSNPPYIASWEMETLERQVREYEPAIALEGGQDGLEFYRRIAFHAPRFLRPGGMLAFEVGWQQASDVVSLLQSSFTDISTVQDVAGSYRVVSGCKGKG